VIHDKEILRMSLVGLNAERDKIDAMIESVQRQLEGPGLPPAVANAAPKPTLVKKKRRLSPEGRAAIAAGARRRWAKQKKVARTMKRERAA